MHVLKIPKNPLGRGLRNGRLIYPHGRSSLTAVSRAQSDDLAAEVRPPSSLGLNLPMAPVSLEIKSCQ